MQAIRYLRISAICAVAFAVIAFVMKSLPDVPGDLPVIRFVQGWEGPSLTQTMLFLSFIGGTKGAVPISIVMMLILFIFFGHRRELLLFLWSVLGSYLLNKLLKWLFHRDRPDIHRIVTEEGFSFPSGHAMQAFAMYATLTYLLWRHIPSQFGRGLLLAFSALIMLAIGTSRVYLGVHYPSDVLGSYAASAAWLFFSLFLFLRAGWLRRR
jgi:undecaprenyl-diphosphatase